jgi:hypothetical protein
LLAYLYNVVETWWYMNDTYMQVILSIVVIILIVYIVMSRGL